MKSAEDFESISKKYELGIYKELNLLTSKEKRLKKFEIEKWQIKEIWEFCGQLIEKDQREDFFDYLEQNKNLKDGLSYLHHHFLDGNSMFTYSVKQCCKKWTIDYFAKQKIPVKIPQDKEEIVLSLLSLLSEKDSKNRWSIQLSSLEYYLFILELSGKITKYKNNIYISEEIRNESLNKITK